jgi:hypothetical protein
MIDAKLKVRPYALDDGYDASCVRRGKYGFSVRYCLATSMVDG